MRMFALYLRMFLKFRHKTGFFLFMLFILQFFVLLPLVYHENPLSPYFKIFKLSYETMVSKANAMNRVRAEVAAEYFKSQPSGDSLSYYNAVANKPSVSMVVAIITVSRTAGKSENDSLGYLLQSSSSVDSFARSGEFINNTFVFICNADMHPGDHQLATYLKQFLPYSERYGASSFGVTEFELPDESDTYRNKVHKKTYEKENFDYSYCLKVANSFNPEYVLMVEDDSLPHKDLPGVLKYSLKNHLRQRRGQFGYLKLYYPEKWQGFANEFPRILELISIGCVGGGICLLCIYRSYRRLTLKTMIGFFVYGFFFSILTAQFAGRQNMMELRRLSNSLYQFRTSPTCCTPAMLYPTSVIEQLAAYLTSVSASAHTDLAIAAHFRRRHLPAYQLEPNLFYHIGKHSTLKENDKDPEHFLIHIPI